MNEKEKKHGKEKIQPENQSAAEIAGAMAGNMQANMENPNFIEEQELIKDEVRRKIIQQRNERNKQNKQE